MAERNVGPAPAPAVSAFLGGVERRAGLLASLQCGDEAAAELALSAAMRAFSRQAGEQALADWPLRFWRLLAAVPGLHGDGPSAIPTSMRWADTPLSHLAGLHPGDRLALLLRLVAGLDEAQAAQALDIGVPDYQQALAAACPRLPDGQADALGWRQLAEALQQQLRDLPPTRLARLAQLREGALSGQRLEPVRNGVSRPVQAVSSKHGSSKPVVSKPVPSNTLSHRRRWLAATAVLLICAGAFIATYYWVPWQTVVPAPAPALTEPWQNGTAALAATPVIAIEPLPAPPPPASVATDQSGSHADAELLMAADQALVRQADFLAWYLATHGDDASATNAGAHANAAR